MTDLNIIHTLAELQQVSHILREAKPNAMSDIAKLLTQLVNVDECAVARLSTNNAALEIIGQFSRQTSLPRTVTKTVLLESSPIARKIISTGKMVIIPQPAHDAVLVSKFGKRYAHHHGCLLGVPLRSADGVLGLITLVGYRVEHHFDAAAQSVVEVVATQVAFTMDNQQLRQQAHQRAREMITIAEVGREVSLRLELPHVLERIARRTTDLLPHTSLILYRRANETTLKPLFTAGESHEAELRRHTVTLGEGIIGQIAERWGAEIIIDLTADPRAVPMPDQYMVSDKPKSLLCATLVSKETIIGAIALWLPHEAGYFYRAHLNFLVGMAQQMVIAVENSQLYHEIQREKRLFEALLMHSPVATVMLDVNEYTVTSWNPAAERLFGYTRDEAVGQHIHALIKNRFLNADKIDYAALSQLLEQSQLIIEGKQGDGRPVYVELLSVPVMIANETVSNLVLYHDVTELERARKEVEYTNAALSEVNFELQILADRLQDELHMAHQIQASLLPPAKPDWPNLDVICYSIPAREVGGDLYAYHVNRATALSQPSSYVLAVGDVSGKGMPAALLMAVSMASFYAMVGHGLSPAILLSRLDKSIAMFTQKTRQNCALIYAEITPPTFNPYLAADDDLPTLPRTGNPPEEQIVGEMQTGHLRVANAGCIPPYIKRTSGAVEVLEVGGVPLGIGIGAQLGYDEGYTTLSHGDLIIFTSDGVVEATNLWDEMFGFERLETSIRTGPQANAEAMLDHLKRAVFGFTARAEQNDDLTIVVVQA